MRTTKRIFVGLAALSASATLGLTVIALGAALISGMNGA